MAVQAVAGLPWLAGILATLFGGILSFFAKYLSYRVARFAAAITAVVALFGALVATFEGLLSGIVVAFPGSSTWGLVVPSNLTGCIAAYASARIAKYVYYWQTTVIQWKLGI